MANHAALIRADNDGLSVARRGRRFIEFALPDGKRRHVATIDPLHKRDSETEIDATWYPDTGAWQWKIGENDWQAHARSVFNVGSLIEWRHESGEWVVVDPQSINWINQDNSRQQIAIKQAVTGTASDATLTFTDAYGTGRHFEYIAHPRRLIKHFVLDQALPDPAAWLTGTLWFEVEWTITNSTGVELYLDGVKWARKNKVKTQTANAIEFRSLATGEVLWYADAPHAADANGETVAAQYQVENQAGSYFIRVRVPREWLLAAAYPVAVDPTFTDGYGGDVTTAKDTSLAGFGATTYNFGVSVNLLARNGTQGKALVEFDLASIAATSTCDSATVYFYKAITGSSTTDYTYTIYSIASGNGAWIEGTKDAEQAASGEPCYDALAADGSGGVTTAWAGSAGCSTSGTDYEASSIGSFGFQEADAAGTEYNSALTAARVEDWFGASNTNYGIVFWGAAGNTLNSAMCSSDHATTGYRPKLVVEYTEAGSTYTLTQDAAGSYALTGKDPALAAARKLALDAGAYTLAGKDAAVLRGYPLAADAGNYTLAGKDPTLIAARALAADAGAYTLAGKDAALTIARLLTADAAGAYTLTGRDATLTYATAGAYTLTADNAGAYALTGHAAGLIAARVLAPDTGVHTLTGADAALVRGFLLALDAGAYTTSGADPTLTAALRLDAGAGAYTTTGQDAALTIARALAAEAGSYVVTGADAGLTLARVLGLDAGAYTVAGKDATLTADVLTDYTLTADAAGAYALTGLPVTIIYSGLVTPDDRIYVVAAEGRVYIVAAESRTHTVAAEGRVYTAA